MDLRFVKLYSAMDKHSWDGHADNAGAHRACATATDRPSACLLIDVKQRGLLKETLAVWAGMFGRTPVMQGNKGRNRNPYRGTKGGIATPMASPSGWLVGGSKEGRQSARLTESAIVPSGPRSR